MAEARLQQKRKSERRSTSSAKFLEDPRQKTHGGDCPNSKHGNSQIHKTRSGNMAREDFQNTEAQIYTAGPPTTRTKLLKNERRNRLSSQTCKRVHALLLISFYTQKKKDWA